MNPVDIAAADYIVSLWGRKRRAFARAYWLALTRSMPHPGFNGVFGAARIADNLISIVRCDPGWGEGDSNVRTASKRPRSSDAQ